VDYENFDLRITSAGGPEFDAYASSSQGEAHGSFRLPVAGSTVGFRTVLDDSLWRLTRHLKTVDRVAGVPDSEALGNSMFKAMFGAGELRDLYMKSLGVAGDHRTRLRIRLRLARQDLTTLRWELLRDEAERQFLALGGSVSLVRYLEQSRAIPNLSIDPPLRILGMVASPHDLERLDTETEKQRVNEAVAPLREKGDAEVTWIAGGTLQDLHAHLSLKSDGFKQWHVFHFIGHGMFQRDEGYLAFVGAASPNAELVAASRLGELLVDRGLRLVVLNACEGAREGSGQDASGIAATLARAGVPAVVGMSTEILDAAAIEFARSFYATLVDRGQPIDAAATEGRLALRRQRPGSLDWASPVVYLRASDGRLFQSAPGPPPEPPAAPPSELLRARDELCRAVKRKCINDELMRSLDGAELQVPDLEFWVAPADVGRTTRGRAKQLPSNTTIAQAFDEAVGQLMILGDKGAGKTLLLLQLANELLTAAEHDDTRPVPVHLELISWGKERKRLDQWIIESVASIYKVGATSTAGLLVHGSILPLLDGLDELPSEQRAACVSAINEFQNSRPAPDSLAVASRLEEYESLPRSVTVQVRETVVVQPLTDEQIWQYVASVGAEAEKFREPLRNRKDLFELARSPLMLWMMRTIVREFATLQPSQGEMPDGPTYITKRYVELLLERSSESQSLYSRQQIRHWLSSLARTLTHEQQAELLLERLQPEWLECQARRWYTVLDRAGTGMLLGAAVAALAANLLSPMVGVFSGLAFFLIGFLFGGTDSIAPSPRDDLIGMGRRVFRGAMVIGLPVACIGLLADVIWPDSDAKLVAAWTALCCGVLGALANVIAGGLAAGLAFHPRRITPVEEVRWNPRKAWVSARGAMGVGPLALCLVGGLAVGILFFVYVFQWDGYPRLMQNLLFKMIIGVTVGLGLGISTFVALGLALGGVGGMTGYQLDADKRLRPNQGIHSSARQALQVFLWVTFLSVPLVALIALPTLFLMSATTTGPSLAMLGSLAVLGSLAIGLISALSYGGQSCLSHGALRFMLSRADVLPLRTQRFLEFANRHVLLRRAGGGYKFLHPSLLEYFAKSGDGER
jgi:hypothetical protein